MTHEKSATVYFTAERLVSETGSRPDRHGVIDLKVPLGPAPRLDSVPAYVE